MSDCIDFETWQRISDVLGESVEDAYSDYLHCPSGHPNEAALYRKYTEEFYIRDLFKRRFRFDSALCEHIERDMRIFRARQRRAPHIKL